MSNIKIFLMLSGYQLTWLMCVFGELLYNSFLPGLICGLLFLTICFIKSDNKLHNIFGLWSLNLIDQLEKDLKNGSRKVEKWANNTGVKIINMSFEKKDPFFNINTREDLIEAEKILND